MAKFIRFIYILHGCKLFLNSYITSGYINQCLDYFFVEYTAKNSALPLIFINYYFCFLN